MMQPLSLLLSFLSRAPLPRSFPGGFSGIWEEFIGAKIPNGETGPGWREKGEVRNNGTRPYFDEVFA